jgi:predicted amidohydrolase YtcJ
MSMRFRFTVTLALACGLLIGGCSPRQEPADLVLLHGKLATVDDAMPIATALAARDGRIVAVGSDEEVEAWVGDETEVIDLAGRLAIPGFIEGHGHLTGMGQALMNVRVGDAETWEEVVALVGAAVREAAPGQWIVGRGWHQDKWAHTPPGAVEGYPLHNRLSEVAPDNPVALRHASGHATIVNAAALELAGIDRDTPDPPGGTILRDGRGEPTGVLRETAAGLVGRAHQAAMASRSAEQLAAEHRRSVDLAVEECLENGVTSFQDAGSSFETVDLLREMADAGELGIRMWVMLRVGNDELERRIGDYRLIDHADHRLTVRAIKRSLDGALGSHGAWLLEPYEDLPQSSGLNTLPLEDLEETARIAVENDFQLCVHAIGDRANRETLDLFQRTFEAHPAETGLRWRVEHAQHLHPEDIPRFAGLGVIASMQAVHCTSDGPWVPDRIGMKRAEEGAYVWRKLMDSGAVVTNGTDAPVEDVSPIESYYATVSRRTREGDVFFPDQRLNRSEALRTYTIHAAYAAFEEQDKGSLTVGKLADVVVLSQDILTIDEEAIPATEVDYTIVGGEVKYRR